MRAFKSITILLSLILIASCADSTDFNAPPQSCTTDLTANLSFAELEAWFPGQTVHIQNNWVLEGYIVSSDRAGNFFNVLHIQDHPTRPTRGLQLEIELRDSHLFFDVGRKILIKLKGLYLGKSRETLQLGGTFTSFGNISVGQLPTLKIPEHIFLSCNAVPALQPTPVTPTTVDTLLLNTLVRFEGLQVIEAEIDQLFAVAKEETERTLTDCEANEITLLTSGYSDFQAEPLPAGRGAISGILLQDGSNFQLAVRSLEDIDLSGERCTAVTSKNLFISELADPDNTLNARFVELYNAAAEPLAMRNWTLRRYTNANTDISSTIDLSGFTIGAQSTFVIAPNAEVFKEVYGFAPDMGVSGGGPADSNGDDNLELVDPSGTVIDRFGVVGEDGSGTNHEFEDGRALRKPHITDGNPTYTFEEWTIFNDTGAAGTTNAPQNAPDDFSPGERN